MAFPLVMNHQHSALFAAFCFYLCSVTGFELCNFYKTICIFCILKYSGNFICEAESTSYSNPPQPFFCLVPAHFLTDFQTFLPVSEQYLLHCPIPPSGSPPAIHTCLSPLSELRSVRDCPALSFPIKTFLPVAEPFWYSRLFHHSASKHPA